ncbi:MAG: 5-oxoprolinase subunit PxpB [Planctomycetota bacterium]|nr:5-oxoprolinase subunit PxpB [Planctomycetota bacterium]
MADSVEAEVYFSAVETVTGGRMGFFHGERKLMKCLSIGERAVALSLTGAAREGTIGRVRAIAEMLAAAKVPGVEDIVPTPGRVTVVFESDARAARASLEKVLTSAAAQAASATEHKAETHEIPVVYDGPDLDAVCTAHHIDRHRFVTQHTEPDYTVEAIGFLPGFGYLAGLPDALATPRRVTPRVRVPAGAVGIGGRHTGVYPCASPGGWNLVGTSPVRLFDVTRSRPSLLAVGDRVRFLAVDGAPPRHEQPGASEPIESAPQCAAITVVHPGLFTTVQDLGRRGYRALGVPLSGAVDGMSLRIANLLVGNRETAAGLECTLLGPTLRFERDATIAVVGAAFPGLPPDRPVQVTAGTEIAFGHASVGCRGCLAVAGGVDVPMVLGSRSTLVVAGMGGHAGRPLRAGDQLMIGDALRIRHASIPWVPIEARTARRSGVLRVIPDEDATWAAPAIWSRSFRASSRSDRMGLRLDGEPLACAVHVGSMTSVAVFPGSVQVPPDGCPIVLLADAQTIGGYPVIGQVIEADLPLAAQLRPGDDVRLLPTSIEEAHDAMRDRTEMLASLRSPLDGSEL